MLLARPTASCRTLGLGGSCGDQDEDEHRAPRGPSGHPSPRRRGGHIVRTGDSGHREEKPQEGEVIAVGPGRWDEDGEKRIPVDVKAGDRVLYSKYAGTEVKIDGEELLVVPARDILARIN